MVLLKPAAFDLYKQQNQLLFRKYMDTTTVSARITELITQKEFEVGRNTEKRKVKAVIGDALNTVFAINGFHEQHLDTQRETLTNLIECYYCRFVDGDVDERCTYFQKVLTFAHTIRCKVKYDKTIRKLLVIMKERNRVFEALTATYQMESTDSRMENCLSELLMLVNDIKHSLFYTLGL